MQDPKKEINKVAESYIKHNALQRVDLYLNYTVNNKGNLLKVNNIDLKWRSPLRFAFSLENNTNPLINIDKNVADVTLFYRVNCNLFTKGITVYSYDFKVNFQFNATDESFKLINSESKFNF